MLWSDRLTAHGQAASHRAAHVKLLAAFVKEKASLDRQYAKSLRKLVSKLSASPTTAETPAPMSRAARAISRVEASECEQLRVFFAQFAGSCAALAANHDILSTKLTERVARPLEELALNHADRVKQLAGDGARLGKMYTQHSGVLGKVIKHVERASMTALRARTEAAETARRGEPHAVIRSKCLHALADTRRALVADLRYVNTVKAMERFRYGTFDGGVAAVLSGYQAAEKTRLVALAASFTNFASVTQAMLQSQERNAAALVALAGNLDPERELQTFVDAFGDEHVRLSPVEPVRTFAGHPMWVDERAVPMIDPEIRRNHAVAARAGFGVSVMVDHGDLDVVSEDAPFRPQERRVERVPKTPEQAAAETVLTAVVERLRAGQTLLPDDLNECRVLFETADGRLAFAAVLNENRTRNRVDACLYDGLVQLMTLFLDPAHAAMHVRAAQLIMILSQTFYILVDGTKQFMQSSVCEHPMWKDLRFWEEAFFDHFKLELAKHGVASPRRMSRSELVDEQRRQKNIVFSCLATFAQTMVSFGVEGKEVKAFVERLSAINELTEEHVEMLASLQYEETKEEDEADEQHAGLLEDEAAAVEVSPVDT